MDLVKKIIKDKTPCVIISPHYDDAVLSCGELLMQIAGKVDMTIVNVFTKAHNKPYTFSAKKQLKNSSYSDAEALNKKREEEDKKVLSIFPVSIINLGLEDALFRRKEHSTFLGKFIPEFSHSYPTYRWHVLKGISKNDKAVSVLKDKLGSFSNKKCFIFGPYGIGNHVDHIIVRKVCEELFGHVLLYSDFPYNVRFHDYGKPLTKGSVYTLYPNREKKIKLIEGYKTQFLGLFPNGVVPEHKEVYFSNKQL